MSQDRSTTPKRPAAIYVWLVPSEDVLDQPGSWRIRKWDTEPFPEATFTLSETTAGKETQPSEQWKCWREARPMALEPYYTYWVSHLTSEGLYDKADIATVLALLHEQRDENYDDARRLHKDKCDLIDANIARSANMATIDADELAALRKDRESLNSMATLLAEARRERDEAQGRPVKPHRSGGPDAEADYRRSDSQAVKK